MGRAGEVIRTSSGPWMPAPVDPRTGSVRNTDRQAREMAHKSERHKDGDLFNSPWHRPFGNGEKAGTYGASWPLCGSTAWMISEHSTAAGRGLTPV